MSFVHLHVHTQYSILDGLSNIASLFDRADELGMPALAITDHGNMYGIKEFFKHAKKHPKVKPIIGCEVYVTRHYDHTIKDSEHRNYYHLILLAKNYEGYKNLMRIVSEGHINGSYYGKPRVSHEVLKQYRENLICCSACLAGELPRNIVAGNMDAARETIKWHKEVFGDDYYLEVQLHKTEVPGLSLEVYENQKIANEGIFALAEEMGVKVIASNDVHFIRKEDGPVHDRLICLTTNADIDDPNRMRYTQQEYLKSEEEMAALFPEHPEVISNTVELSEKIEKYSIDRGHVLPKFELPEDFMKDIDSYLEKYKSVIDEGRYSIKKDKETGEIIEKTFRGDEFCYSVAYLCYITYQGAVDRYGETLSAEQAERLDFELKTICRMGFPDYFLIVSDYIAAQRKIGFYVGPGRGSAAGSAVAYCLGITNLDPIKYNLLFERFLNPDRISMPDIDVDFEDLVAAHQYVEDKYTKDHVSRVITFGTMAAKSAIKDVARISHVSIDESNRLSGMIPDRLSEKVEKEYPFNPELDEVKPGFKVYEKEVDGVVKKFQKGLEEVDVKINLKNCYRLVPEFIEELKNGSELNKEVLFYAQKLEGSIRQVGVHACATIIGRGDLRDYIPISTAKDKDTGEDVWISQYDGHYIEDVGMLKMDFLGLNTLSIIKECMKNIEGRFGHSFDIEKIPIDDKLTYELYGRGDTDSVFQFESPGMKNWLQRLHPERFEDLIAMNALYRPGPMDYIPDFVDRKLGKAKIEYDLPDMEEFLEETYGVTVYQEQVMLLSRKLANFTKGQADQLRKAMGKKLIDVLNDLKDKFMDGGKANGHPEKVLDKIWKDWEKFAQYAFNKSHATCYAWVSYQTGYLKAHYTAEFLAANLSCNLNKMDEIKKIMGDCKSHNIKVLNPDINESLAKFTVNKEGNIRFGLGGMKGFGANVVDAIIKERTENGLFADIYDFIERMSGQVNKKAFESLVNAGAFDSFGYKRSQYFLPGNSGEFFTDDIVRYGELFRNDKVDSAMSLFGEVEEMKPTRPEFKEFVGDEDLMEILRREKEIVGMYLSSHPLDRYEFEITNFTNCPLSEAQARINAAKDDKKKETFNFAGIITDIKRVTTKTGNPGARVTMEDYTGVYEFGLYGKEYDGFLKYLNMGEQLYIESETTLRFKLRPEEKAQGKEESYKWSIKEVSLLGQLAEEKVRSFDILVDSSMLSPEFRKKLVKTLGSYKGKTPLGLILFDKGKGYKVDFSSKKFMVAVCSPFLRELDSMGIKYDIKKK